MIRFLCIVFVLGCMLVATEGHAQSRKKKKHKNDKEKAYTTDVSSAKNTSNESGVFSSEMKFSKKKFTTAADGMKRAQDLQEANAKKYRKMAHDMETDPRYNDPSYFGHKHKPKKHRPGKKKFCKECGIVH